MDATLLTQQVIDRASAVRVPPTMTIREALEPMDRAGVGIVLIADPDHRLVGIVTDGDVRRAILRQVPLTALCTDIATRNPIVAEPDVTLPEALQRMAANNGLSHLPIISADRRVLGLLLRSDLVDEALLPIAAVVMAGGFGSRLYPYTVDTPKPLLPVGDRPVMEYLVEELRLSGIHHVNISTFHQAEKIKAHFGDGARFGVAFNYVTEDRPLGTAGALGLMDVNDEPLLVINGDILTRVNFRAMLDYHRKYGADLTIAVRPHDYEIPYGVLDCTGNRVDALREKPVASWLVNAGIYLLEASARRLIAVNEHCDMTDLISRAIEAELKVISFPVVEYWLDIGRHTDYARAEQDVRRGRIAR